MLSLSFSLTPFGHWQGIPELSNHRQSSVNVKVETPILKDFK